MRILGEQMNICKKCDGEGVTIEDTEVICEACNGLGVIDVPTHIYLQLVNLDEITWCVDRIYDNDQKYSLENINKLPLDKPE